MEGPSASLHLRGYARCDITKEKARPSLACGLGGILSYILWLTAWEIVLLAKEKGRMRRVTPNVLRKIAELKEFTSPQMIALLPQYSPNSIRDVIQRLKKGGYLKVRRNGKRNMVVYSLSEDPEKLAEFRELLGDYGITL
jgi:excinuclease UvrABC ATPase subunit